jgi:hypothetical protein
VEKGFKMDEQEELWVVATLADVDDIIQTYGVEYFLEKLPRYAKIAITAHMRKKYANASGRSIPRD